MAIILSAGFGTRLKTLTEKTPKPLLPINNHPMLFYTLKELEYFGVTDVCVNTHYLANQIEEFLKNHQNSHSTMKITWAFEEAPTGTAGGCKLFQDHIDLFDNVIVIYGDILSDINYGEMLDFHQKHRRLATMAIHHRQTSNSIVELDPHSFQVTNFYERPSADFLEAYRSTHPDGIWVNSAIYIFQKEFFQRVPQYKSLQNPMDLPKDFFGKLTEEGELFAYKIKATRYAIDSVEKYREAEKNFSLFRFHSQH